MPLDMALKKGVDYPIIKYLLENGANISSSISTQIVSLAYSNNDMSLINSLLDQGTDGSVILISAGEKGDNETIKTLISRGVQIRSEQGAEALKKAAVNGKLGTVKLLVENGVNVNARDKDGNTALSVAYDKGEMEVYDYLKSKGARDFEPKQVASAPPPSSQPSQPRQTYNDSYDYTPPPSSSSSSSTSSTPSRNTAKEVVDTINRAFEAPLENGRYRISGRTEEMSFAGIAKSGNVTFKDAAGTTYRGTYSIDGSRLTINVMNRSFFYTVTSKTTFSGNGESWVRVGF